jgi:DNA-directed RNA polymerase subunit RPC12/RpoP
MDGVINIVCQKCLKKNQIRSTRLNADGSFYGRCVNCGHRIIYKNSRNPFGFDEAGSLKIGLKNKPSKTVSSQYDYEEMHQNITVLIEDVQKKINPGLYFNKKFIAAFDGTVILKYLFFLHLMACKAGHRLGKKIAKYLFPALIITTQREQIEEYLKILRNNIDAVSFDLEPLLRKDIENLQDILHMINESKDNIRKYFINYPEEHQDDPRLISKFRRVEYFAMLGMVVFVWGIPGLCYSNPTIKTFMELISCKNIFPFMKCLSEVSFFPDITLMVLSQAFYGSIFFGVYRYFNQMIPVRCSRFWFIRYFPSIVSVLFIFVIYFLSDDLMRLMVSLFRGRLIMNPLILYITAVSIFMTGEFLGNLLYLLKREILPLLINQRILDKQENLK